MLTDTQTETVGSGDSGKEEVTLLPTIADQVKTLVPKYAAVNSRWFKSNFLNKDEFSNEFVDGVFQNAMELPEFAAKYKTEKDITEAKQNYKNGLTKDFIKESYTGESLQDLIVGRTVEKYDVLNLPYTQLIPKDKEEDFNEAEFRIGLKNPNRKKEAVKGAYENFVTEFTKIHNGGAQTDPDSLATAFNTYLIYGSEGLTEMVNAMQPKEGEEPKFSTMVKKYIPGTATSLGRYNQEFMSGLEYKPIKAMDDILLDFPKDLTAFNVDYYDGKVDGANTKNFSTRLFNIAKGYKEDNGFLGQLFGGDMDDYNIDQLELDLKADADTDALEYVIQKNTRAALSGDAPYSIQDVFNSVASVATLELDDSGNPTYTVDYGGLNVAQKAAFKMLQTPITGNPYAPSVRDMGDGVYTIEPGKQTRLQQEYRDNWFPTNKEWVVADDGRLEEKEILTTMGSIGMGLTSTYQAMWDTMFKPLTDVALMALPDETAKQIRNSDIYVAAEERANVDLGSMSTDWMDTTLNVAGAFAGYATSIYGTGALAAGGIARLMNVARNAKTFMIAANASQYAAKLPEYTKAAMQTKRILGNKALAQMAKFELGGAIIDVGTGMAQEQESFAMLGGENISDAYLRSNKTTQAFANVALSIGSSAIVDSVLAAARMPFQLLRGKSRGLKFDDVAGEFSFKSGTTFNSDYRRMWYAATEDLADMPAREVADAYTTHFKNAGLQFTPQNAKTQDDVFDMVSETIRPYYTSMRNDIKKTLKFHDNRFNAAPMGEDALNARVDKIYNESLDKVADEIYTSLKGGGSSTEYLPLRYANYLRGKAPQIKNVGSFENQSDALAKQAEFPNTRVIQRTATGFDVHDVEPNFWGIELGNKIIKRYSKIDREEATTNFLRNNTPELHQKLISGAKLTEQEAKDLEAINGSIDEFFDKVTIHEGKPVRVVGFDEQGFVAVDEIDNTLVRGVNPVSGFDAGKAMFEKLKEVAEFNNVITQRQAVTKAKQTKLVIKQDGSFKTTDEITTELKGIDDQISAKKAEIDALKPKKKVKGSGQSKETKAKTKALTQEIADLQTQKREVESAAEALGLTSKREFVGEELKLGQQEPLGLPERGVSRIVEYDEDLSRIILDADEKQLRELYNTITPENFAKLNPDAAKKLGSFATQPTSVTVARPVTEVGVTQNIKRIAELEGDELRRFIASANISADEYAMYPKTIQDKVQAVTDKSRMGVVPVSPASRVSERPEIKLLAEKNAKDEVGKAVTARVKQDEIPIEELEGLKAYFPRLTREEVYGLYVKPLVDKFNSLLPKGKDKTTPLKITADTKKQFAEVEAKNVLYKELEEITATLDEYKRGVKEYSSDQINKLTTRKDELEAILEKEIKLSKAELERNSLLQDINNITTAIKAVFGDDAEQKQAFEIVEKLKQAYELKQRLVDAVSETKYHPGDTLENVTKRGVGMKAVTLIRKLYGSFTKANMVDIVKRLGMDNTVGYGAVGKNKGAVKQLDVVRLKLKPIEEGIVVKYNNSYYISRKKTSELPFPYGIDTDGRVLPNEHWARIDTNQTINADGTFKRFKQIEENTYVEVGADVADTDVVYLNIQKAALDLGDIEMYEAVSKGIDAFEVPPIPNAKGEKPNLTYIVFSKDQIVTPNSLKHDTSKIVKTKGIPKCG